MFLNRRIGYTESLDFTTVPGYDKLSDAQRENVHRVYDNAYHSTDHLGIKVAMGKAHETAKASVGEELKVNDEQVQLVLPGIFDGLENCN